MADTRVKSSPFYTRIQPVIKHPLVQSFAPIIFNLVFIAIFTAFAIRPTIETISNLHKTIDNDQTILDALDKKAQNLSQGKKNLENIPAEKRAKIDNAIPSQPSVPSLVHSLQNSFASQASISGLLVQPLTIFDLTSNQPTLATPGEVDFSINLQGSYSDLLKVLANLTSSPRIISINALTLSKQKEDAPINLSLTGKAFFVK